MEKFKSNERAITDIAFNKSHFIKFSECIAKELKDFDAAITLSVFFDIEDYFNSNPKCINFLNWSKGYFYCKSSYMEDRNGMSEHRFRKAISKLEDRNFILSKKWVGNWKIYKINHDEVSKCLISNTLDKLSRKLERNIEIESQLDEIEQLQKRKDNLPKLPTP